MLTTVSPAVHPRVRALPATHRLVPVLARIRAHPRMGVPSLAALLPARSRARADLLEPPVGDRLPPRGSRPPIPVAPALPADPAMDWGPHDGVCRAARGARGVLHGSRSLGCALVTKTLDLLSVLVLVLVHRIISICFILVRHTYHQVNIPTLLLEFLGTILHFVCNISLQR